jgi:hypothetical protein
MIREMLNELHLAPYIRRFKTSAGHTLSDKGGDLIDCSFEGITERFELVAQCFPNQSEEMIPYDDSFMQPYVLLSELLDAVGHIETIESASPTSGWGIMNRYIAASASVIPLPRTEKDKPTESSPPCSTFSRGDISGADESGYKSVSLTMESPPVCDLV